jgi:hypothetical protein
MSSGQRDKQLMGVGVMVLKSNIEYELQSFAEASVCCICGLSASRADTTGASKATDQGRKDRRPDPYRFNLQAVPTGGMIRSVA